jgi:hypothetical protein
MITIFANFRQFSEKKIDVFLKNQFYDQNFALFSFVLSQKRQLLAIFFGENIFKIITSVPGLPDFSCYNIPKRENISNDHKFTKWS